MYVMKVFIDTETTGLVAPALVEIAFAELGHEPLVLRCKPRKPIELDATVVNGIRNKDVAHLPLLADHPQYSWLKKHLEQSTIVAHNAPFDVGVLANEGIHVKSFIDTKELAKKRWPNAPRHRLQHLRYWLDLEVDGADGIGPIAHTAGGDVKVLMALWQALERKGKIDTYVQETLSTELQQSQSPPPVQRSGSSVKNGRAPSRTLREQLRKRNAEKRSRPRKKP